MSTSLRSPLVGVVVPAFDVELWLGPMLDSLRAQTHESWRAVVVDDGSSDGSVAIAERHAAAEPRIAIASNPNRGPGARLARIHGRSLLPDDIDYVYFPDGDDLLEPQLLERLVDRLEARPDAVAAFCHFSEIDAAGGAVESPARPRSTLSRRWARSLADWEEDTPFASLYTGAPAWEGLTMLRRNAYDGAGGLESSPPWISHTTLDLLLRLSLRGSVVFVPDCLYRRRLRPGQMSDQRSVIDANDTAFKQRWRERAGLDPEVRRAFTQGDFLLRHRLTPRWRLKNAAALARRGNVVAAAPRVVLAAAAYRWRLPSDAV